jgi:hypothetical protein
LITFTNGRLIMLNLIYISNIKILKKKINTRLINKNRMQSLYSIKFDQKQKTYLSFGTSRSFCSSNVKLKAESYVSIKDLASNLQAESSAEAARRIVRNPNPNRIACLVRRIYTIFIEIDLDTKINNMNDLLLEDFWTENQEMGDKAKIALEKMLRHENLDEQEVFCVDDFFTKEGISLEGLRLDDLRSKIETCQNFYTHKFLELQEKLNEWNEEKNNLLLQQQEEESNKDKGKQPDYSLHYSYNYSQDINNKDFKSNNLKTNEILYTNIGLYKQKGVYDNDNLSFNCLENKRKFSDINGLDIYDEGKIVKKAKIYHNTSLLDDYADISCEPLDIIDLDG